MSSKRDYSLPGGYPVRSKIVVWLTFFLIVVGISSCTSSGDETDLINRLTTASKDVVSISFPASSTETVLSINSVFDFSLQGLKSNGIDQVALTNNIEWSLSAGASSTIYQNGRFTAGAIAELVTLTAKYGFLTVSIDIRVSSAKFDQVVQLNEQTLSIDMCRSQSIKPVARYVDENGNEEIRQLDSVSINTIEWIIRNKEDGQLSKRAYIETTNNQASLYALADGDIIVQAKAISLYSGNEITSADLEQTISAGLNSIKLCNNSDTDFSSCGVTTVSLEKDTVLSLIAVANYQASDGSSFNENISKNSKWGISNTANATIAFSADRNQLDITGVTEQSSAELSVACGAIDQALDAIDVSQGVVLDSAINCTSGSQCLDATATVNIEQLSVLSFDVTANDISLTNNVSVGLSTRPAEIKLSVTANYTNDTLADITDDTGLVYSIIAINGQVNVIEQKSGSTGVFTVLDQGTAKIQLDYRYMQFIVVVIVP